MMMSCQSPPNDCKEFPFIILRYRSRILCKVNVKKKKILNKKMFKTAYVNLFHIYFHPLNYCSSFV
jgi:hypothetical protein